MDQFDPEDYAANPGSLPAHSDIRQCLSYGVHFELDAVKQLWFAKHPRMVTSGKSQVKAASEMMGKAR